MAVQTKWLAAALAALTILATAPTVAQQEVPATIDVDKLVADMGLTGEARAEMVGWLTELNALVDRGDLTAPTCYGSNSTLSDIPVQLAPAQWERLYQALLGIGLTRHMGHFDSHGVMYGMAHGPGTGHMGMGTGMYSGRMHHAGYMMRMPRTGGS